MEELDSRLHGNDKKFPFTREDEIGLLVFLFHENVKMETIDSRSHGNVKLKILDSRFHGNDKKIMNDKIENGFLFSKE